VTVNSPIRWLCGVISAPRPASTLDATLRSLAAAGWTEPIVFCDYQRQGQMWNWMRALDGMIRIAEVEQKEWLLICEDDIEVTPTLRHNITLWPRAWRGVLSLYCSIGLNYPGGRGFEELFATSAKGQGALAYAMTLNVARKLRWDLCDCDTPLGSDHLVPVACQRLCIPFFIHCPSLIRHTGTTTSLRRPVGDERFRNCHSWVERFNDDGSMVVKEIMGSSGGGSEGSMASESASVAGVAAASEPGGEPGNHI
jgi:hypothetical protein